MQNEQCGIAKVAKQIYPLQPQNVLNQSQINAYYENLYYSSSDSNIKD